MSDINFSELKKAWQDNAEQREESIEEGSMARKKEFGESDPNNKDKLVDIRAPKSSKFAKDGSYATDRDAFKVISKLNIGYTTIRVTGKMAALPLIDKDRVAEPNLELLSSAVKQQTNRLFISKDNLLQLSPLKLSNDIDNTEQRTYAIIALQLLGIPMGGIPFVYVHERSSVNLTDKNLRFMLSVETLLEKAPSMTLDFADEDIGRGVMAVDVLISALVQVHLKLMDIHNSITNKINCFRSFISFQLLKGQGIASPDIKMDAMAIDRRAVGNTFIYTTRNSVIERGYEIYSSILPRIGKTGVTRELTPSGSLVVGITKAMYLPSIVIGVFRKSEVLKNDPERQAKAISILSPILSAARSLSIATPKSQGHIGQLMVEDCVEDEVTRRLWNSKTDRYQGNGIPGASPVYGKNFITGNKNVAHFSDDEQELTDIAFTMDHEDEVYVHERYKRNFSCFPFHYDEQKSLLQAWPVSETMWALFGNREELNYISYTHLYRDALALYVLYATDTDIVRLITSVPRDICRQMYSHFGLVEEPMNRFEYTLLTMIMAAYVYVALSVVDEDIAKGWYIRFTAKWPLAVDFAMSKGS